MQATAKITAKQKARFADRILQLLNLVFGSIIPFDEIMEVSRVARKVKSTTDTSAVGTRNDIPVNFPFVAGRTSPTALAAPVLEGMMLMAAARPPLQSFFEGPSTVFWVAV